jgi:hypothetical protein
MNKLKIKVTYVEPLLGSSNNNPYILEEHRKAGISEMKLAEEQVAIKAPAKSADVAEAEADEALTKQTTVFPRNPDGSIFRWDYQIRGYFKEAINVGIETGAEEVGELSKWTIKKAVDSYLFITERRVNLLNADGTPCQKVGLLERPLRAETMQGTRICLSRSEVLPEGTNYTCTINWLPSVKNKKTLIDEGVIRWALDYGMLKGEGQWRNGGFGRFTYEILK